MVPPPRSEGASSRSPWTTSTRTTWPPSSITRESPCARGITAPCPFTRSSVLPRRREPASTCTTCPPISRSWWKGYGRRSKSVTDEPRRFLPAGHPRPLPEPSQLGHARETRYHRPGREPPVRRRDPDRSQGQGREGRGGSVQRQRLFDQPRGRVHAHGGD